MNVSIVDLDIAKNIFHIVSVSTYGLKSFVNARPTVIRFCHSLTCRLIGMETCTYIKESHGKQFASICAALYFLPDVAKLS